MSHPPVILGIDPGLRLTGYGVIAFDLLRPRVIDAGVIRLSSKMTVADRLVELERELADIITEHKPDYCGIEKLYAHSKHPATAVLMAHARGVILLCARRAGCTVREISANRIKRSMVGFGHAGKAQMQRGVAAVFGLATVPQPPDVADALAIALCCGREISRTDLPVSCAPVSRLPSPQPKARAG